MFCGLLSQASVETIDQQSMEVFMRREDGDVLGLVSDELARQAIAELIQIQAERGRLRLEKERRDSKQLQRLIVTAFILAVIIHFWV